jgi:hypothetical protein
VGIAVFIEEQLRLGLIAKKADYIAITLSTDFPLFP